MFLVIYVDQSVNSLVTPYTKPPSQYGTVSFAPFSIITSAQQYNENANAVKAVVLLDYCPTVLRLFHAKCPLKDAFFWSRAYFNKQRVNLMLHSYLLAKRVVHPQYISYQISKIVYLIKSSKYIHFFIFPKSIHSQKNSSFHKSPQKATHLSVLLDVLYDANFQIIPHIPYPI